MLISLMAMHSGLLDMPILYISPVMEQYKDEYIDLMFNVSCRSEWTPWFNFFFDRITESCRDAIATVDRIIDLQTLFRERAREVSRSASILMLVDVLFETTVISVNEAKEKLNVTYPAAKTAIDKLVAIGILVQLPGTYPYLYFSPEIRRASRPIEQART
jgi:Fic family protein